MNQDREESKKERHLEIEAIKKAQEERMIADSINGLYIPKNMEDCFITLDSLLSKQDRNFIKNLESRDETIEFHLGLGMWLRNNWGLWGGSRLQTYFLNKKIEHPDDMSSIILEYYYDWLNGKHEGWKKFHEKN